MLFNKLIFRIKINTVIEKYLEITNSVVRQLSRGQVLQWPTCFLDQRGAENIHHVQVVSLTQDQC